MFPAGEDNKVPPPQLHHSIAANAENIVTYEDRLKVTEFVGVSGQDPTADKSSTDSHHLGREGEAVTHLGTPSAPEASWMFGEALAEMTSATELFNRMTNMSQDSGRLEHRLYDMRQISERLYNKLRASFTFLKKLLDKLDGAELGRQFEEEFGALQMGLEQSLNATRLFLDEVKTAGMSISGFVCDLQNASRRLSGAPKTGEERGKQFLFTSARHLAPSEILPEKSTGDSDSNTDKTVEKLTTSKHCAATVLVDEVLLSRALAFTSQQLGLLEKAIKYGEEEELAAASKATGLNSRSGMVLPAKASDLFGAYREFYLEDALDFMIHLQRGAPQILLESCPLELPQQLLIFICNSHFVKSPFLAAKCVEVFFNVCPQVNPQAVSLHTTILNHPFAADSLCYSLMKFYADVEVTGSHTEFFDKLTFRRQVQVIFESMWNNALHRHIMIEECGKCGSQFVRFVNMLIKDTTFLLDESPPPSGDPRGGEEDGKDSGVWDLARKRRAAASDGEVGAGPGVGEELATVRSSHRSHIWIPHRAHSGALPR